MEPEAASVVVASPRTVEASLGVVAAAAAVVGDSLPPPHLPLPGAVAVVPPRRRNECPASPGGRFSAVKVPHSVDASERLPTNPTEASAPCADFAPCECCCGRF